MTKMPRDVKTAQGPGAGPAMQTTNPFPNPILTPESEAFSAPGNEEHPLPPYSEEDTASQSQSRSQTLEAPPPPQVHQQQPQTGRVPESNAVNASSEVHITGPLHVLGYVSYTSSDLHLSQGHFFLPDHVALSYTPYTQPSNLFRPHQIFTRN